MCCSRSSVCSFDKANRPEGLDRDDVIIIPISTANRKVIGVKQAKSGTFLPDEIRLWRRLNDFDGYPAVTEYQMSN